MGEDYTVFVQLVGGENSRVAERHTYPGLGRFPTSLWPVGQAFCDVYRLHVQDWAPVPELYDLVIGLYNAETSERLACYDRDGALIEYPVISQVRVTPKEPLAVAPAHRLDCRLGAGIRLLGFDMDGPLSENETVTVTLYWHALEAPVDDYTSFVHLVSGRGDIVAQHDGIPRGGRYPTPAWQVGDIVPDKHILVIPAVLRDEPSTLAVGMYHSDTGVRLPAAGPGGRVADDLILLPLD
jgi:hypothetical protein